MSHMSPALSTRSIPRKSTFGPLVVCFALLAACQNQVDSSSPRAVATLVVTALDKGDAATFMGVLPSDSQLESTFDCGRTPQGLASLQRRREDAPAEFAARRQAGHRVRLVHFDRPGSTTTTLEVGDVFHGCAARVPVTVHRSRIELSLSKSGRIDVDIETWTFLRFTPEGPWYFAKL